MTRRSHPVLTALPGARTPYQPLEPERENVNVPLPPPNRGRLLTAAQVAETIGSVSSAWVRRYVPHKLRLGHSTVRWYEHDVLTWIESRQEQDSPRS